MLQDNDCFMSGFSPSPDLALQRLETQSVTKLVKHLINLAFALLIRYQVKFSCVLTWEVLFYFPSFANDFEENPLLQEIKFLSPYLCKNRLLFLSDSIHSFFIRPFNNFQLGRLGCFQNSLE